MKMFYSVSPDSSHHLSKPMPSHGILRSKFLCQGYCRLFVIWLKKGAFRISQIFFAGDPAIKEKSSNKLLQDAKNMDMLIGDYLFDLMSGDESDLETIKEYTE